MYKFFRSLLFRLDPELAHHLTLQAIRFAGNFPPSHWFLTQLYKAPPKPIQAFGLTFKNPVGLAAGYDKDAIAIRGLSTLGFGHVEVGTVTPKPQPGNARPRVFRLPEGRETCSLEVVCFAWRSMSHQQSLSLLHRPRVVL